MGPVKESANIFSSWSLWWLNALFSLGAKRQLTLEDIPILTKDKGALPLLKKYDKLQAKKTSKGHSTFLTSPFLLQTSQNFHSDKSGVFGTLTTMFKAELIVMLICGFGEYFPFSVFPSAALPCAVGKLPSARVEWHGYLLAASFFFGNFFADIIYQRCAVLGIVAAIKARAVLMAAVYRKSLKLKSVSAVIGEVITIQSSHVTRIAEFYSDVVSIPVSVVCILAVIFLLIDFIGYVAASSVALTMLVMVLPYPWFGGAHIETMRDRVSSITDKRISLMNEILSSIKAIKLYSWEFHFSSFVTRKREEEAKGLRRLNMTFFTMGSLAQVAPTVATMVGLAVYAVYGDDLRGRTLTPAIAFAVNSIVSISMKPIVNLFTAIKSASESKVSFQHIDAFLQSEEAVDLRQFGDSKSTPIKMIGDFTWDLTSDNPDFAPESKDGKGDVTMMTHSGKAVALSGFNISFKKGELVAVVGPSGSGKSTLLSAILGLVNFDQGSVVSVSGKISYVPQQAWLLNGSIRSNVLFIDEFDRDRLTKVYDGCQLVQDLKTLPGGDMTEVGEKGVNLSGGQKARISIARALYSNRDIVLLDDPLGACDVKVAQKIFDVAIRNQMKDKTVIFVTNQINFLPKCDRILVMNNGKIIADGSFRELSSKGIEFDKLSKNSKVTSVKSKDVAPAIPKWVRDDGFAESQRNFRDLKEGVESSGSLTNIADLELDFTKDDEAEAAGRLIAHESDQLGADRSSWLTYLRASGGVFGLGGLMFSFSLFQLARLSADMWLSRWSDDRYMFNTWTYIWFYMIFVGGSMVFSTICDIYYVIWSTSAATNIHNEAFSSLMAAPLKFFNETPIGRVLNRFSKDQDVIDNSLPETLLVALRNFFLVIIAVVFISVYMPWFLIGVVPAIIGLIGAVIFFRKTQIQLKTLSSIALTPVFNHLSSTLDGVSSIRAYNVEERFMNENLEKVDKAVAAQYSVWVGARWLAVRFALASTIFISFVAFLLILLKIDPGTAGVLLLYSQNLYVFQLMSRMFVETEAHLTSVERLHFFVSSVPKEATIVANEEARVPESWPSGVLTFKKVSAAYNIGGKDVISDVSLKIEKGEKVGIVGRTGAGKTSLVLALFRIIPLTGGKILIDDVDISAVNLSTLRSRIAIIPQDPVLFNGTLRRNLDFFENHTDTDIWDTLEKVNLKDLIIQSMPMRLDTKVEDGGSNLNVGFRQLLCIARAVLMRSRILVMDEATSALDIETDKMLQTAIRRYFSNATVIAIAHRLHTITDYDKILVMEDGHLLEVGTPKELASNRESHFSKLLAASGKEEAQLRKMINRGARASRKNNIAHVVYYGKTGMIPELSPERTDWSNDKSNDRTEEESSISSKSSATQSDKLYRSSPKDKKSSSKSAHSLSDEASDNPADEVDLEDDNDSKSSSASISSYSSGELYQDI